MPLRAVFKKTKDSLRHGHRHDSRQNSAAVAYSQTNVNSAAPATDPAKQESAPLQANQPADGSPTTEPAPQALWDTAFDTLVQEKPEQMAKYMELLNTALAHVQAKKGQQHPGLDVPLSPNNVLARRDQLQQIVELGLQHMKDQSIRTTVLGHEIVLQDQVRNAAAAVEWAKDFLKEATATVPYTSVVWAGVSLILPLLKNPPAEDKASQDGFVEVAASMDYFSAMETMLLPKSLTPAVQKLVRARLARLYQSILDFQIQCILHYYRSRTKKYLRGLVKHDDFATMKESIDKQRDALLRDLKPTQDGAQVAVGESMLEQMVKLSTIADRTRSLLEQLVQKQEGREHGDDERVRRDDQDKPPQSLSKEDKKCLQDLCLTEPEDEARRIERTKGGLLTDCADWVLAHPSFCQWKESRTCRVLWLNGGPGKGKTMLMLRIIHEFETDAKLAVQKHPKKQCRTLLAYHLCQGTDATFNTASAVLRSLIYQIVRQDARLIRYVQDEYDMRGPRMYEGDNAVHTLRRILIAILDDLASRESAGQKEKGQEGKEEEGEEGPTSVVYFFVDALDECVSGLETLLELISQTAASSPSACLVKWVVSSRVIPDVQDVLDNMDDSTASAAGIGGGPIVARLSLEANANVVSEAISTYIHGKVKNLPALKALTGSKKNVLQKELVDVLQAKAEGTFLWVALAVEQLGKVRYHGSMLQVVHGLPKGLEPFYGRMMEQLANLDENDLRICKTVLSVVALAKIPLCLHELQLLACPQTRIGDDCDSNDDDDDVGDVHGLVNLCGSFLVVRHSCVYFLHQSARDYLVTKAAQTIFPEGHGAAHFGLFTRSLDGLASVLRRDLYNIQKPGVLIKDIKEPTDRNPLRAAAYAAVYWVEHFCAAAPRETIDSDESYRADWVRALSDGGCIFTFLRTHFLHWIESCSLLRQYTRLLLGIRRLSHTGGELAIASCQGLRPFLGDAERFVRDFRDIMEVAPLQIYVSALVFCPMETEIKRLFWAERLPLVSAVQGGTPRAWDNECITKFEHNVSNQNWWTMSLNSDGTRLAAHYEKQIRLWDTNNGELILAHQLPYTPVRTRSYAFWPDDQTLVCGSDHGLLLFDALSGIQKDTVTPEPTVLCSPFTIFSPDGRTVASISPITWSYLRLPKDPVPISIWDTKTGKLLHHLSCYLPLHLRQTNATFTRALLSADSRYFAAVYSSSAVCVWDVSSGELMSFTSYETDIELSTESVKEIAFFEDSERLVIALTRSIRILNLKTMDYGGGWELDRHDWSRIHHLSRDGSLALSFSDSCRRLRLWDVPSGALEQELDLAVPNNYLGTSLTFSTAKNAGLMAYSCSSHIDPIRILSLRTSSSLEAAKIGATALGSQHEHKLSRPQRYAHLAISPDMTRLVYVFYSTETRLSQSLYETKRCLAILDLNSAARPRVLVEDVLPAHRRSPQFSADSNQIAAPIGNDQIYVFDCRDDHTLFTGEPGGLATFYGFSPDGSFLLVAKHYAAVCATSTLDWKTAWELPLGVAIVCFSADSMFCALYDEDKKNIVVVDLKLGTVQSTKSMANTFVLDILFVPGSHSLAALTWNSKKDQRRLHYWSWKGEQSSYAIGFNTAMTEIYQTDLQQCIVIGAAELNKKLLLYLGEKKEDCAVRRPPVELEHNEEWVTYGGEKVLWLPGECREYSATMPSVVVIGYGEGQPMRVEFNLAELADLLKADETSRDEGMPTPDDDFEWWPVEE